MFLAEFSLGLEFILKLFIEEKVSKKKRFHWESGKNDWNLSE